MLSLMLTVASMQGIEPLQLTHYSTEVETSLSHGQGYLIPALIWPPPPDESNIRLLMKLILKVAS